MSAPTIAAAGMRAAPATRAPRAATPPGRPGARRQAARAAARLPAPLRGTAPRRALVAEFVAAALILGLTPVSPAHTDDGPADWLRRATALAGLFALLGLASTAGPRSARVAAAFGGITVLGMLIAERELVVSLAARVTAPAGKGIARIDVGESWPGEQEKEDLTKGQTKETITRGGS